MCTCQVNEDCGNPHTIRRDHNDEPDDDNDVDQNCHQHYYILISEFLIALINNLNSSRFGLFHILGFNVFHIFCLLNRTDQ